MEFGLEVNAEGCSPEVGLMERNRLGLLKDEEMKG